MRHFVVAGGCAEIPACKTILNESDFKMLLGQFAVEYSQLGNVNLTIDTMKTYIIYNCAIKINIEDSNYLL